MRARRWGSTWPMPAGKGAAGANRCASLPNQACLPFNSALCPLLREIGETRARGSSRWRRSTPPRAAASSAGFRGRSAVASARPGSPRRCERAAPGATRGTHAVRSCARRKSRRPPKHLLLSAPAALLCGFAGVAARRSARRLAEVAAEVDSCPRIRARADPAGGLVLAARGAAATIKGLAALERESAPFILAAPSFPRFLRNRSAA